MVAIKSSVLMAAAAFSAASALPTTNLNLDMDVNDAMPSSTSTSTLKDFGVASAAGAVPSAASTGRAVIDVNVDMNNLNGVLARRRQKEDKSDTDSGLKRSVKNMVQAVEQSSEQAAKQSQGQGKRMWKGRQAKRGPWRATDGDNLIDLNIGHAATQASPEGHRHLIGSGTTQDSGNLIDIALRSPRHDDDRVILTGDGDAYYRNAGHRHGYSHDHDHGHEHSLEDVHEHVHIHDHSRRHHRHHSVVEVIGDDYRYDHGHGSHQGHAADYEFIDDGSSHSHEHAHVHEHLGRRRHNDDRVEIIDASRRHHDGKIVEVIHGDHYGHGDEYAHVHEHIHSRSHYDGDIVVVGGGRHHGHGNDVTVVNHDGHGHYNHGHDNDVTVVNNDGHGRHSSSTTVVNNKRSSGSSPASSLSSSPKSGFSSKLAGLGRAFLKRHRGSDTTIVNNDGGRHGHSDTIFVNNDNGRDHGRYHHNGDTTIINNADHGHGSHHHGSSGDTTVVNNKRGHHHSDRIVVIGDSRRYRDADFYQRHAWDNGLEYGKPIYFSNGDDFNRVRVVHGGRHGDLINVDSMPYQSVHYGPVGYSRYGYNYGKRGHDAGRKTRGGKHGHHGHLDKNRKGDDSSDHGKRHYSGDGDVTIINEGHRGGHHNHGNNDVTVVNNGNGNHHHAAGDVTVVNNNNHKRNHGDRHGHHRHESHRSEECRHGRCDTRGDVTIVNNDKREARHEQYDRHGDRWDGHHGHRNGNHHGGDVTVINNKRPEAVQANALGGAPGYIDVTSPVYNSTTAQRIASLVLSTSNGTDPNSTFVLNASSNIRTQVYLVPVNPSNSTASAAAAPSTPGNATSTAASSPIQVNLKVPIFVASSASVEPYCATFDPSPENPAPLTVTPCTDDASSHESQKFLYNPDTGVIHPDWQPSTNAQQLLQAVPDDVGDEAYGAASDADITAAMTTASATMAAADAFATDADFEAYSASMTATGIPSASASLARRAAAATTTLVPISSSTGSASSSPSISATASASASATSTSTNSPPPLSTSGPHTSTDSSALPQTNSPSNVTLIFTPVNPSLNTATSLNYDEPEAQTQADPDAQQATMSQLGRRSDQTPPESFDGAGGPDINSASYSSSANNGDVNSDSSDHGDVNSASESGADSTTENAGNDSNINGNGNDSSIQSAAAPASAPATQDNGSSSNGNGINASANINLNVQPLIGDSVLQKPMAAPASLTAPYEWRWTRADPESESDAVDESAFNSSGNSIVV